MKGQTCMSQSTYFLRERPERPNPKRPNSKGRILKTAINDVRSENGHNVTVGFKNTEKMRASFIDGPKYRISPEVCRKNFKE